MCPELSNPDNGRAKLTSAGRSVGAQVWYICNDGFILVGSESRRCQSNLQWSLMAPTCKPKFCPRLNNPENGIVKFFSAGRSVGAKVQYKCSSGFSLVGSEFRRCQSDRQWSLKAPTCQRSFCPRLEEPQNGRIKYPEGKSVGADVWYVCDTGFTLVGSESRRCQSNLQWSLMAPTCQPKFCPRLNNPENGIVKFFSAGRSVGAKVQYKCSSGFSLVGSEFRRCQSDRQWSLKAPTCQRSFCPRLEEPQNGQVKFSDAGRSVGAEVEYKCDKGFKLFGVETRRCQSNLKWSFQAPTCKRKCHPLMK